MEMKMIVQEVLEQWLLKIKPIKSNLYFLSVHIHGNIYIQYRFAEMKLLEC